MAPDEAAQAAMLLLELKDTPLMHMTDNSRGSSHGPNFYGLEQMGAAV
jgi:hypothetical protein